MAGRRDDMVIVPRIQRRERSPRKRAAEERQTRVQKRKRRGAFRRLRAARMARLASKGRAARRTVRRPKRGGAKTAAFRGLRTGVGAASKAVGVIGLVMEAIIMLGRGARRAGGQSGRLVEATDANTLLGDLDERATANASVLGQVEASPDILRTIHKQGGVPAQIQANIRDMKRRALNIARGADLINLEPNFDSADSLIDRLIAKANEAKLPDLATKTIKAIKDRGAAGSIKSAK